MKKISTTVLYYFNDITKKEYELRRSLAKLRCKPSIEADEITKLENMYEDLLETSEKFNLNVFLKLSDINVFHDLYNSFNDKYVLLKEYLNIYK